MGMAGEKKLDKASLEDVLGEEVETEEEADAAEGAAFDNEESGEAAESEVDDLTPDDLEKEKKEEEEAAAKKAEAKPEPQNDDLHKVLNAVDGLSIRLRSMEGRQGEFKDNLQKVSDAAQAAESKAGTTDGPTPEQLAAAKESKEADDKLREDFPEWYTSADQRDDRINARIDAEISKVQGGVTKEEVASIVKAAIKDDRIAVKEEEGIQQEKVRQQEVYTKLEKDYPNWDTVTVKTPEFTDWYQKAGDSIQLAGNSDDPSDARKVMDAFAAFVKSTDDNDEPELEDEGEELTAKEKAKLKLEKAVQPTKSKGKPRKSGRGLQTEAEGFDSEAD